MNNEQEEPRRVWWHSQNLNEDAEGNIKGTILRHGRGSLHLLPSRSGIERAIGLSWQCPTRFFHAKFEIGGGDGDEVSADFACGLFALWLHVEGFLPRRFWDLGRETGVSFHDGSAYFKVWATSMGWDSRDPKWQQFSFCPADFFLGRQQYSTREIGTENVLVPTPEGAYPGTARKFESTWTRPRWPFAKKMVRVEIDMDTPVPVPGKGENSWDCDDDALYSITTPKSSTAEAVGSAVASVLRDRERYGGKGWLPPGTKAVSA